VILVDVNTAEALVVIFIVVSLAVIGGWFLFFSDAIGSIYRNQDGGK